MIIETKFNFGDKVYIISHTEYNKWFCISDCMTIKSVAIIIEDNRYKMIRYDIIGENGGAIIIAHEEDIFKSLDEARRECAIRDSNFNRSNQQ